MGEEKYYKIIESGDIAKLRPSPCDNPIILELIDGTIDVLFLRELEETSITFADLPPNTKVKKKNVIKGRPEGLTHKTKSKMFEILYYLEKQDKPVSRSEMEKELGFHCVRPLMSMPFTRKKETPKYLGINLESLGIVERVPAERACWVRWQLSDLGREKGTEIIEENT